MEEDTPEARFALRVAQARSGALTRAAAFKLLAHGILGGPLVERKLRAVNAIPLGPFTESGPQLLGLALNGSLLAVNIPDGYITQPIRYGPDCLLIWVVPKPGFWTYMNSVADYTGHKGDDVLTALHEHPVRPITPQEQSDGSFSTGFALEVSTHRTVVKTYSPRPTFKLYRDGEHKLTVTV